MRTEHRRDPLLRALGFLGLRGRPLVWSLFLGVAGALSALALAALSAWLITRAWQQPPILFLSVAITAVRALGISRGVFRYLERLATHDLALGAMATARERVYRTLAAGDPAYSVSLRRGDLLRRTGDDIDEIGNALIRGIIPIGVGLVTAVAAVVVMALVSPWAAVVLAVALLVSAVLAPRLAARGAARSIADGEHAATVSAEATTTALWHAPELTVAGRRESVVAAAAQADDDAMAAADRGFGVQALAAAATPLALGASLIAACIIGIGLAGEVPGSLMGASSSDGVLTPMILGVLILLPLSAFESTAPLTEAGIQLERSRQSAARVMALVDAAQGGDAVGVDRAVDVAVHASPTQLDLRGLRWGWGGPAPVLGPAEGLSRVLPVGSRLVVVGPSGSGKSTLLMTLAGLLAPRSGSLTYRDADGDIVEPRSAACYFAEEGHIFSTTLRDNLLVARGDATDAEIDAALDAVGLGDWVAGLPDGRDTVLVGGAEAISGGQRRRLLLARAMLHPAPVVLLDEPTEHLDADDADALMAGLVGSGPSLFGAQRTVIVVTHQVSGVPDGVDVVVVESATAR